MTPAWFAIGGPAGAVAAVRIRTGTVKAGGAMAIECGKKGSERRFRECTLLKGARQ